MNFASFKEKLPHKRPPPADPAKAFGAARQTPEELARQRYSTTGAPVQENNGILSGWITRFASRTSTARAPDRNTIYANAPAGMIPFTDPYGNPVFDAAGNPVYVPDTGSPLPERREADYARQSEEAFNRFAGLAYSMQDVPECPPPSYSEPFYPPPPETYPPFSPEFSPPPVENVWQPVYEPSLWDDGEGFSEPPPVSDYRVESPAFDPGLYAVPQESAPEMNRYQTPYGTYYGMQDPGYSDGYVPAAPPAAPRMNRRAARPKRTFHLKDLHYTMWSGAILLSLTLIVFSFVYACAL